MKAEGRIAKTKIRAVPKKAARVHKEAWCVFQNAHGAFAEMLKVRLQKCSQCVCRNAHGAFSEMLMVRLPKCSWCAEKGLKQCRLILKQCIERLVKYSHRLIEFSKSL